MLHHIDSAMLCVREFGVCILTSESPALLNIVFHVYYCGVAVYIYIWFGLFLVALSLSFSLFISTKTKKHILWPLRSAYGSNETTADNPSSPHQTLITALTCSSINNRLRPAQAVIALAMPHTIYRRMWNKCVCIYLLKMVLWWWCWAPNCATTIPITSGNMYIIAFWHCFESVVR